MKAKPGYLVVGPDERYLGYKRQSVYGWVTGREAARVFRTLGSAATQAKRWNAKVIKEQ